MRVYEGPSELKVALHHKVDTESELSTWASALLWCPPLPGAIVRDLHSHSHHGFGTARWTTTVVYNPHRPQYPQPGIFSLSGQVRFGIDFAVRNTSAGIEFAFERTTNSFPSRLIAYTLHVQVRSGRQIKTDSAKYKCCRAVEYGWASDGAFQSPFRRLTGDLREKYF